MSTSALEKLVPQVIVHAFIRKACSSKNLSTFVSGRLVPKGNATFENNCQHSLLLLIFEEKSRFPLEIF